jgi:hypothetical protein
MLRPLFREPTSDRIIDPSPNPTAVSNRSPGIVPMGHEDHLIRAILEPPKAAEHWVRYWEARGNTEPDEGETRLFPLIMLPSGVAHIQQTRWQSALRKAQMQSIVLKRTQARLENLFLQAEVPAFLTKGQALQHAVYGRSELRTSSDIDIIIRWKDAARLLAKFREDQWFTQKAPKRFDELAEISSVAMCFSRRGDASVDITWAPRRTFSFDPLLRTDLWVHHSGTGIQTPPMTWLLTELAKSP